MGYQIRAFCVGIKNENIQFVIHFDVIIYHIRIILTEKELIFVVYVTQTVHTLMIVKRKYSQTTHCQGTPPFNPMGNASFFGRFLSEMIFELTLPYQHNNQF